MKRFLSKKRKQPVETPSRITNETVAEHRERILAGGRRFKYPRQYLRHKLVINAIIISVVTAVIIVVAGWAALYPGQNTSEFMYRVTRVIPLPVAYVDGKEALYSDYLMRYRSQELWLRNQGQIIANAGDEKRQLDFIKRSVLDGVIADTYAEKLAPSLHATVSDEDVQAVIDNNRHTANGVISQEVYDASTKDTLGYSPDEYRHIIKQSLLRQKVAYALDTKAQNTKYKIEMLLRNKKQKKTIDALVATLKKQKITVDVGASGLVPKDNQDGGLSQEALTLRSGQISPAFKSTTGDGYYFVEKVTSNDKQVSYRYIRIPLTVFTEKVQAIKKSHKIKELISIPDVKTINK